MPDVEDQPNGVRPWKSSIGQPNTDNLVALSVVASSSGFHRRRKATGVLAPLISGRNRVWGLEHSLHVPHSEVDRCRGLTVNRGPHVWRQLERLFSDNYLTVFTPEGRAGVRRRRGGEAPTAWDGKNALNPGVWGEAPSQAKRLIPVGLGPYTFDKCYRSNCR